MCLDDDCWVLVFYCMCTMYLCVREWEVKAFLKKFISELI